MAKNSYFRDVNSEQDLLHDLTIETIKIHGRDMVYIPRTFVKEDALFGEDTISKFEGGVEIEMYIQSIDGFGGDGDFISKFGLEIKFVEHENPFYQIGKLYTYKLSCELFKYSHEDLDTGFSEVDQLETTENTLAVDLTLGSLIGTTADYFDGETVYQGDSLALATATAVVIDWDSDTKVLRVDQIKGRTDPNADELILDSNAFSNGVNVIGVDSGAIYSLSSSAETDLIVGQDGYTDSLIIDKEADKNDLIDFSEVDPFSEGNY
jgi:hypothetical protein